MRVVSGIRARRHFLTSCLLLVSLLGFQLSAHAQLAQSADVVLQVKAAYLYKFGNYVEWPPTAFESADSPIRIGVIGADRLADVLMDTVVGRTINGRKIEASKLRPGDELTGLHIVFIGDVNAGRMTSLLAEARELSVLTVTDSERAFGMGSMINFVEVDRRLRFDIAQAPAHQGRLNISARLLVAARKVVQGVS